MASENLQSVLHAVAHTDRVVGHPRSRVWALFRDIRTWYREYRFEVVSGPPYEAAVGLMEGQTLKVTGSKGLPRAYTGDALGPEYYLQKNIKVTPENEIVVVLSGSAYDWTRYTAFYVWRLAEHTRDTLISIDSYVEAHLFRPLPTSEWSRYLEELEKNWHRSWSEALSALEAVLAQRPRAPGY